MLYRTAKINYVEDAEVWITYIIEKKSGYGLYRKFVCVKCRCQSVYKALQEKNVLSSPFGKLRMSIISVLPVGHSFSPVSSNPFTVW